MYQAAQPVVNTFAPEELLYRRCTKDEVEGDHLEPTAISFKGWSVNRGSLSEPEDVLIPDDDAVDDNYDGWGIAYFEVRDVPLSLETEGSNVFTFKPVHVPKPENYSHSEIRTFRNGVLDLRAKLTTINKLKLKQLKEAFSRKTRILLQPQIYASTKMPD